MTPYLFVFGRTPALALHELRSVVSSVSESSPSVAIAQTDKSPTALIARLGGTVKIARIQKQADEITPEILAEILLENSPKSLDFGISFYDLPTSVANPRIAARVKELLQKQGVSARFVAPKHEEALSSVVVAKQGIVELVLAPGEKGGIVVARTVAVQDFEDWNKRDYGRPQADPKAGMLPPKVARMAVNIALGYARHEPKTLLDPFCGMGTVLAEALLSGAPVIGSDQSSTAVEGAQKNLKWLGLAYPKTDVSKAQLFVSDATHVSEHMSPGSVGAIATEPFMGATAVGGKDWDVTPSKVSDILKGLEKLYIGCLRDWQKVLGEKGIIVIALPEYRVGGRSFFVKRVVDSCETLGYTCLAGPIEYSRPQAVVRRQFFVFQKI
jgi:tRNA G10  N-methylase Trm11